MSTYEELPLKRVGSAVDTCGAELIRSRFADGKPVVVRIWGTNEDGNISRTSELVIASRDDLGGLAHALLAMYYGWPGDHR